MVTASANLLRTISLLLLAVPAWVGFQCLPWQDDEESSGWDFNRYSGEV